MHISSTTPATGMALSQKAVTAAMTLLAAAMALTYFKLSTPQEPTPSNGNSVYLVSEHWRSGTDEQYTQQRTLGVFQTLEAANAYATIVMRKLDGLTRIRSGENSVSSAPFAGTRQRSPQHKTFLDGTKGYVVYWAHTTTIRVEKLEAGKLKVGERAEDGVVVEPLTAAVTEISN